MNMGRVVCDKFARMNIISRTYRAFAGLLATVLVVGTAWPILCHACGLSEAAGHMGSATSVVHDMSGSAMDHCVHGSGAEHPMSDADASHMPSGCEADACIVEADEPAPMVYAERTASRLSGAMAGVVQASHARDTAPIRWEVPWEHESTPGYHPVPVRLLTSSFLL